MLYSSYFKDALHILQEHCGHFILVLDKEFTVEFWHRACTEEDGDGCDSEIYITLANESEPLVRLTFGYSGGTADDLGGGVFFYDGGWLVANPWNSAQSLHLYGEILQTMAVTSMSLAYEAPRLQDKQPDEEMLSDIRNDWHIASWHPRIEKVEYSQDGEIDVLVLEHETIDLSEFLAPTSRFAVYGNMVRKLIDKGEEASN